MSIKYKNGKNNQLSSSIVKKMLNDLNNKKKTNKINKIYQLPNDITNPFLSSFELKYQTAYPKNYLDKSKNESFLNIESLSDSKKDGQNSLIIKKNNKFKTKIFLTNNKRNTNNVIKKCKSKEELIENDFILNRIFEDNKERNKYSNLPFFCLTKKKIKFSDDEKTNIKILNEDFLYKISHGDRFYTNNENNNFIRNKQIKKGLTTNYIKNNNVQNQLSLPEVKFDLTINNLNKNKREKIKSKEKYLLMLKKNLIDLKNGNIFKQLEEDINNFNEDNILSKDKNKNLKEKNREGKIIKKENDLNSINIIDKKKNLKKVKSYILRSIIFDKKNNKTNYQMKKPLKYPINFYSNKQLEIKKKRYEKTHREGWKEFNRKTNIRNMGYNSYKITKNPILLCVLEPNRDLQKKKVMTNKKIYLHECRIRDILISNKLKFDYNKEDIKRILNGQKPWKELNLNNKDNKGEIK